MNNKSPKFIDIPSLKPVGAGVQADGEHVAIKHGSSVLKMSDDGKFAITGVESLLPLIQEICQACADILVNTQIGPQGPINKATFLSLKSRLGGMSL